MGEDERVSRRIGIGVLILMLVLLTLVVGRSQEALERGNRLHRAGRHEAAADVFASRVDTTGSGLRATYNLGTALLQLGSEEAERYLVRSSEGSDSAAAQRAHYNLAYRLLSGVEPDTDPFAAIPLLSGAIDHNRAALRMDPTDENAKWNLALALRAYGQVPQVFEEGPAETDGETNIPEEDTELAPSEPDARGGGEELEEAPLSDSRADPSAVSVGVREAAAGSDPGPLSEEAADRLMEEALRDDPERLVRGILWSERPAPPASGGERYPGGSR